VLQFIPTFSFCLSHRLKLLASVFQTFTSRTKLGRSEI